jgi:hypothetical protein
VAPSTPSVARLKLDRKYMKALLRGFDPRDERRDIHSVAVGMAGESANDS